MLSSFFTLFTLVLWLLVSSCNGREVNAECGSVKVDYPLLRGRIEGPRETTQRPIRIVAQFITANISAEVSGQIQAPINAAIQYYQDILSVNRFTTGLAAPPTCEEQVDNINQCPTLVRPMCGPHVHVSAEHTGTILVCNVDRTTCQVRGITGSSSDPGVRDADYVLYVTSTQDATCQNEPIVGYAGPCVYAQDNDNQPYMGFINICPMAFTRYDSEFVNLFVRHDLTHALVFLDKLLDLFPEHDEVRTTTQVDGQTVAMITTPNVQYAAQEYYGCSELTGAILENEGGALTQGHWESRVIFPELMNGVLFEHLADFTSISNITLSLFADSGWYTVDYTVGLSGYQVLWGAGLGCDFPTTSCQNSAYPYMCTPCCDSHIQCSFDYQGFGYCTQPPLHDGCGVVLPGRLCVNNNDAVNITDFIPVNTSIAGSILTFNQQSICTEAGRPADTFNINCVQHRCSQLVGTDLFALQIQIRVNSDQTVNEWCRWPGQVILDNRVICPPSDLVCAQSSEITMVNIDNDFIPPPFCDISCGTCQSPKNPATCLTCASDQNRLNGQAPTNCIDRNNPCGANTYQRPDSGGCAECPSGCALCTGPLNSDCQACVDPLLYIDTTDKLDTPCSADCPNSRGAMTRTDQFGKKECIEFDDDDNFGTAVTTSHIGLLITTLMVTLLL